MSKMKTLELSLAFLILQALWGFPLPIHAVNFTNSNLFREYIGALYNGVNFSQVPINKDVKFDFILAFAIDYTDTADPKPTNGKFKIFWDSDTFTPDQVCSIKKRHRNVRVALSIGGASVGNRSASFDPKSVESWVSNAVSSLTEIINDYHLDGLDINYETFKPKSNKTFTECIGKLIKALKKKQVISFASIAPYADPDVQSRYLALWNSPYQSQIDYVNFQFYAYDKSTTVSQFLTYFDKQTSNYKEGNLLVSFVSGEYGGLTPKHGFFKACELLKQRNELYGIFNWCADSSMANKFTYEKQAQKLLAGPRSLNVFRDV